MWGKSKILNPNGIRSIDNVSTRSACFRLSQGQARQVKTLNVYYNDRSVKDLGELRNKWSEWKKVQTISLSPRQVPKLLFNFFMHLGG